MAQSTFQTKCNPYGNFGTKTQFDSKCPSPTGTSKPNTGSFAQDTAKSNFCADSGVAQITITDLASLERAISSDPDYGSWKPGKEPPTRTAFTSLKGPFHEGQQVHLTAYILKAEAADTDSGETVNCQMGTDGSKARTQVGSQQARLYNDIHVALVGPGVTDECQSVTAEITPHYRNAQWTAALFNVKLKGQLVRITGQLMYDTSHKPCQVSGEEPPRRQSSWEIHPVYQVEVCLADDKKGGCKTSFEALNQYLSSSSPSKKTPQARQ
jgi:hypothetical protein